MISSLSQPRAFPLIYPAAEPALAVEKERLCQQRPNELDGLVGAVTPTKDTDCRKLRLDLWGITHLLQIDVCAILGSMIVGRILEARQAA